MVRRSDCRVATLIKFFVLCLRLYLFMIFIFFIILMVTLEHAFGCCREVWTIGDRMLAISFEYLSKKASFQGGRVFYYIAFVISGYIDRPVLVFTLIHIIITSTSISYS